MYIQTRKVFKGCFTFPTFQRGKKVPEGLTTADDITNFQQIASHPVCVYSSVSTVSTLWLAVDLCSVYRVCTVPVYRASWLWIFQEILQELLLVRTF